MSMSTELNVVMAFRSLRASWDSFLMGLQTDGNSFGLSSEDISLISEVIREWEKIPQVQRSDGRSE